MLTIDLESGSMFRALDRLQLIHRATNLSTTETLAIHAAADFRAFLEAQRAEMHVADTTIRLSVGLECVDDLSRTCVRLSRISNCLHSD